MTADGGTWTPQDPGTQVPPPTYRWLRCEPNGTDYTACTFIAGQTSSTYAVTPEDVGKRIRVRVRASNVLVAAEVGSKEADSGPTDIVGRPAIGATSPSVSGSAIVGGTLSASDGDWTGSTPFNAPEYQWQRCQDATTCADIPGAQSQSYGVTSADIGSKLRVLVTYSNTAGKGDPAPSDLTSTVPQPPPTFTQTGPTNPTPTTKTSPGRVLTLLSPFPVVRLTGKVIGRFTVLGRLIVFAPRGATVTVICRGRRCPYRRASKRVRNRSVRFRRLERRLRAGTVIIVIVSRPGTIGKYTRIVFRDNRVPKRQDLCAKPDSNKSTSCPASP